MRNFLFLLFVLTISYSAEAQYGYIAGYVYEGVNNDIPVPNTPIYLRDSTDQITSYTVTTSNGHYEIFEIEAGRHSLFPLVVWYDSVPFNFTIDIVHYSYPTVNFLKDNADSTIGPITTSLVTVDNDTESICLYPNPNKGSLYIWCNNTKSKEGMVIITDVGGRRVLETRVNQKSTNGTLQLDIASLQDGIYLVTVKIGEIEYSSKLTLQH